RSGRQRAGPRRLARDAPARGRALQRHRHPQHRPEPRRPDRTGHRVRPVLLRGPLAGHPEGDGLPTALTKEPWAITDNQGNYSFAGVGPGTHRIRLVPQAGWAQTTPAPAPITADSGQDIAAVDFGVAQTSGPMAAALGNGTRDRLPREQVTRPLDEAFARMGVAVDRPSSLGGRGPLYL